MNILLYPNTGDSTWSFHLMTGSVSAWSNVPVSRYVFRFVR